MSMTTKASLLAIALSIGSGAYAQNTETLPPLPSSYPVCSKTVTDECINADAAPHAIARKAATHRRAPRIARRTTKTMRHVASRSTIAKPMAAKPEARS